MSANELFSDGRAVDWGALIARHSRRVMVALLGRRVPVDRAREIVQETWTKLIEKHAQGALAELKLPGLAIVQALFLARDDVRRARRRASEPLLEEPADEHASAETEMVNQQEAQRALGVLQRLPAKSRRVFELAYERSELTHREIAVQVQLSEQRVRQILCEVRKALRQAVEEQS